MAHTGSRGRGSRLTMGLPAECEERVVGHGREMLPAERDRVGPTLLLLTVAKPLAADSPEHHDDASNVDWNLQHDVTPEVQVSS